MEIQQKEKITKKVGANYNRKQLRKNKIVATLALPGRKLVCSSVLSSVVVN